MARPDLKISLQSFITASGDPGEIIEDIIAIPEGHAGLAYSFTIRMPDGHTRDYVLKMGPAGVPRSGSTDIYRQAVLLKLLHTKDLPVPAVPWASNDEQWIGAPFIVMERLPGKTIIIWEPHIEGDLSAYWFEAAALLARLHATLDVDDLTHWESATSLAAEIDRWERLIKHTADEADRSAAQQLASHFRETLPPCDSLGLIHGDFQPGNILYENEKVTGLIDWDLASVGPRGIDLGWLLMMGDRDAWAENWQPKGAPPSRQLIEAYHEAGGEEIAAIDWYRAFACYRMAIITGMNLKLHRDGRRPDEIWEKFASSATTLLARGCQLLSNAGRPA